MEHETIKLVANEINVLLNLGGAIPLSWGITGKLATLYAGMPAMRFKVNGFLHKGDVVIALNEGEDLYECYLLNDDGGIKEEFKSVYADGVVSLLDREIETGGKSEEEYRQAVAQWLDETNAAQCPDM